MTLFGGITSRVPMGVRTAGTPRAFHQIHQPGCAAAIWQRNPLPAFQSWLDAQNPEHLPRARMILRANAVHEAMVHLCDQSGMADCRERSMLVGDIAALATLFADVSNAEYLRARLDVDQNPMIQNFSVENVTMRLVCTYRGTGLQYGLALNGSDTDGVFTMPTGAPIVLRGPKWPEQPPSGLQYRMPAVGEADQTRLVLVLDAVADATSAPESIAMTRH